MRLNSHLNTDLEMAILTTFKLRVKSQLADFVSDPGKCGPVHQHGEG